MTTSNTSKKRQSMANTPPQVVEDSIHRIVVPMTLGADKYAKAAKYCQLKHEEETAITTVRRSYDCLPWAGGFAAQRVLDRLYSAVALSTSDVDIPTGSVSRSTTTVRWGIYEAVGLGKVHMTTTGSEYGAKFCLVVECRRRDAPAAEQLCDRVQKEIDECPLYRGSAIILKPDEDGTLSLKKPPEVMNVPSIGPEQLVLSARLHRDVNGLIFQLITNPEKIRRKGFEVRCGHLLAGRPGTGKTLTARVAASLAVREGWTVFYLPDARGIEVALRLAQAHQPALLISEDLDRQAGGERNALTDRILNALDGLDRSAQVMFLATTNDDASLPAPLLRPGRTDSVHRFGPPDAGAATELLTRHLGKATPSDVDRAGAVAQGLLPASIKEVARRATILALMTDSEPTSDDLIDAAHAMWEQQRMLEAAEAPKTKIDGRYEVISKESGSSKSSPWKPSHTLPAHATSEYVKHHI